VCCVRCCAEVLCCTGMACRRKEREEAKKKREEAATAAAIAAVAASEAGSGGATGTGAGGVVEDIDPGDELDDASISKVIAAEDRTSTTEPAPSTTLDYQTRKHREEALRMGLRQSAMAGQPDDDDDDDAGTAAHVAPLFDMDD
jgi:hypothetical protein